MSARRVAQFGVLAAVALALGWVERFIPISGIPGVKLGLANTVLLYAVYMMDGKSAWLLMAVKVLLSGFLFAGLSGMLYSLSGGVLSLIAMLLAKRVKRAGVVAVSISGALFHNIGQAAAACFVVLTRAVLGYLPVLLIAGCVTGLLTGVIAKYALRALRHDSPVRGQREGTIK